MKLVGLVENEAEKEELMWVAKVAVVANRAKELGGK